jgi:hopanoid biosynthesis associated protein HpnK
MKRLILSADDFGMSPGINAAVLQAHHQGILSDAGLMVNGAAAENAVELARATPSLSVGLHLVLAQGRAALPPAQIPDLVDGDGFFRVHPIRTALGYFLTPGVRVQLEHEITAQIEKFLAGGLALSHIDGHLNLHMHPTVLKIILSLAPRYGVRALRLTREPLARALRLDHRRFARKLAEGISFNALGLYARRRLAGAGIRHPDRVFGLHQTGHVTESYLSRLLPRLGTGVTEIYSHPARLDAEARRWRPPDYDSEGELAALTSPQLTELIRTSGIERISYRALGEGA